jgi:hypothetical protein
MRRFDAPILLVALLPSLGLTATPLLAQEPQQHPPATTSEPPSLEAFVGPAMGFSNLSATWNWHRDGSWGSYTYYDDTTFAWETSLPIGVEVGANLYFGRKLGIQVLFSHLDSRVTGPPTQFHDNRGYARELPAPHGTASWYVLSFNPIVRGRLGRRLGWTVSGGLSSVWLITDLGAPQGIRLSDRSRQLGGNVGASLDVRVAPRATVFMDVRYAAASAVHHSAAPTDAAPLNPSHLRLMAGVNCLLWRKRGVDIVDGWKAK